jgi:hypothetical protein
MGNCLVKAMRQWNVEAEHGGLTQGRADLVLHGAEPGTQLIVRGLRTYSILRFLVVCTLPIWSSRSRGCRDMTAR